jgi:hypothetical protein
MRKKIDPLVYAIALFCVLLGLLIWRSTSTSNNGKCGEDLTWRFYRTTGELRISGTGEMGGWFHRNNFQPPWAKHARKIKTVSLPEGLTSICLGAFDGCEELTSVTIPEGVKTIEHGAFKGCTGLESIEIPAGVTELDPCAFVDCSNLVEINVHPDNAVYCSAGGVVFSKDKSTLILYPDGRTGTYQIPEGVTCIGFSAFAEREGLTGAVIPEGVTRIESSAFDRCSHLAAVTIPESVQQIGTYAFLCCSDLTSVTLPAGVTSIGESTFRQCKSLETATILNDDCEIAQNAFEGCPVTICGHAASAAERYSKVYGHPFQPIDPEP